MGDLLLVRRELVSLLEAALGRLRAGGDELAPGAVGERLHADPGKHLIGDPQLLARLDPAARLAQPLAEEEMCAGELRTPPRAAQPIDRLAVEIPGRGAAAHQRPAARLDAEREVGAGRLCRLGQPLARIARDFRLAKACGGLDELRKHPYGGPWADGVRE